MITEFSKIVCIPELTLLDSSDKRTFSDARHVYWLLLKNNGFSISQIARLNDKNHATVIAGIKKVKELLSVNDTNITQLYESTKHIKRPMKEILITQEKAKQLKNEAMIRMRWRLWFVFAESKYEQYRYKGNKKKPHYKNINAYCLKHWGKEIGEMTKDELAKHIAQVKKWK